MKVSVWRKRPLAFVLELSEYSGDEERIHSGIVLLTQLLLLGPIPYTVGKAADGQYGSEGEPCKGGHYLAEKNILLVS